MAEIKHRDQATEIKATTANPPVGGSRAQSTLWTQSPLNTSFQFYSTGSSSDKGHLQLHCFPQNQSPVRTCTQHADAKYCYLGIYLAAQDTFCSIHKVTSKVQEKPQNCRTILDGKALQDHESNHSSSPAKNITNPQPQVLHPQSFKSLQQWGPSSSQRATEQHPHGKPQPKISQSLPRTYTQAAEPAPTFSEPPPARNSHKLLAAVCPWL